MRIAKGTVASEGEIGGWDGWTHLNFYIIRREFACEGEED